MIDIEPLLCKTEALMRTTYIVRSDFNLLPKKEHVGICINYQDLQPMTNDFIEELINTVTNYVYSHHKIKHLSAKFQTDRTPEAALSQICFKAKKKFRPSSIQGQFSELLLFNFLQKFFHAVPMLRKMPITTNPNCERNGADAIHISVVDSKYILYLGEAKTFSSKGLKSALKDAIESVLEQYDKHRQELSLYVYDDFISPELQDIAEGYINGKNADLEIHLVCMVTYDKPKATGSVNREDILNKIMHSVQEDMKSVKEEYFSNIPPALLPRMNYILFPVEDLKTVLDEFKKNLGV